MAGETGFRKWAPLVVMALALFIVVIDTTIISVSIKAIIHDLHSNLKAIQWVITGYSLMLAAFTITGGTLGDIFGRKQVFLVGAIIFGIGSLMASRAHSDGFLLLSVSIVEGGGAALMLPATASLLVSTYRGKDRALAFGVYGAIAGVAATVGPIVGGWLTTNYSWRWNYLISPFVVLVLLGGSFLVKEAHERNPHVPDFMSIALSALGLGSVVYGIIESSTYGWLKATQDYELFGQSYHLMGVSISAYAIFFGLIFITLFLLRQAMLEDTGKEPLVSTGLLKNRGFMSGTTVMAIAFLGQFGLFFVFPVFLQGLLGKDAFHSGLATIPLSIGILIASPLSGVLASRFNIAQKYMIQFGLVLSVLGGILLHFEATPTATESNFILGLLCFGFGFGFVVAQLANLTLSAATVQQAGEASGVNNTFRQIGTSLGQALIGAILISTLVSQLHSDIASSKVIPQEYKPQVQTAISSSAQSLGTQNAKAEQLPEPITKEIVRIKNDAIVSGVRTGFLATAVASGAALLLSFTLPLRAQQHAYEPSPKAEPAKSEA